MSEAPRGADIPARFAVIAVVASMGVAYWLGAERAGELRFASESVRRHEADLTDHARRIATAESAIAAQGARIDAQAVATKDLAGKVEAHNTAILSQAKEIEGHAKELEAHARELEAARADSRALAAEVARIAKELERTSGDLDRRDAEHRTLVERIERLERALAGRAER